MKFEPTKIFTSIDLEMNQDSGTIIQVGAVVGDISTGQILDRLSVFVYTDEIIREDIVKLTKIKQKDVQNGVSLLEAYNQLREMHLRHKSFLNPITWGGGDSIELLNQLKSNNYDFGSWCFGRRWIDVKTLFIGYRFANGEQIKGGLARSMSKVGLNFKGHAHDARWDAENTFYMFCKMLEILKI